MMVLISPLLALVALVSVPLSVLVTRMIAKRSQPLFVQQWGQTGRLNAHIEETYTGHALVKVFGHQHEAEEVFAERNEALYRASYGAQFLSGIIMPAIMFIGNLNYVFVAVIGGLRVASGSLSLGDVQAFIQYSRQFSQPLTQVASMANLLQSGVASAERVFELLDAPEQYAGPGEPAPLPADPRAGRVRARVVPLRARRPADRGPVAGRRAGPVGRDRRPDRRRQDHPGQPGHAVLRARRRPDHPRRRRHRERAPRRPARPDRHGAAGRVAVQRHHPRQHRVRPARRDRGGDPGGRAGHVRRPVRALAAGRLRHGDRRRGQQHQRGRAPAGHDRAGVPGRAVAADPRRGDQLGGHPDRGAGPEGDGRAALGPHQLHHRPPALDDPRRRPDPGHGARRASSSRARTPSCWRPAAPTRGCTRRSSPAPSTPSRSTPPRLVG